MCGKCETNYNSDFKGSINVYISYPHLFHTCEKKRSLIGYSNVKVQVDILHLLGLNFLHFPAYCRNYRYPEIYGGTAPEVIK